MEKLKWLLVGAGNIARLRVGAALAQAHGSELCAICDLDRERAEYLAGDLGVAADIFTDFDQALSESEAEAVYVATQVTSHVDLCLKAAQAGKHFLVEKPLALNGRDALDFYSSVKDFPVRNWFTRIRSVCAFIRLNVIASK